MQKPTARLGSVRKLKGLLQLGKTSRYIAPVLTGLGRASLGLTMALAAVGGSSTIVAAQTAPAAQTVTFAYTGAAQTWTVPAGVSHATFDVIGAQGGSGAETPNFSVAGGLGGETTVVLPVTAGQIVQVKVGGAGANGNSAGCSIGYPMKVSCGGFNGGGTSGLGGVYAPDDQGGGGGGASDIRFGAFGLDDRVVVAGGGGGSGFSHSSPGVGGGSSGTGGSDVPPCTTAPGCSPGWSNPITAGRGGTQSAGGAGGAGQVCIPQYVGAAGTKGAGGAAQQRGGGGGGGWFGGGGGSDCAIGTPGGGGSGYSSAPGAVFQTGVRSGNGLVTITYTVTTPRTVVAYNPTGSQCSCGPVSPASVASDFTASNLSQVGMIGGWGNTDVWPVGQIGPSSSINPGQYLTYSVTPNHPTKFTSLSLSEQSYVGQGPQNASVRTSLDGFATDSATMSGLNPAGFNQIVFNLANLPVTSHQVEFRVYFFNTPSNGQDWADLVSTNRAGATGLVLTGEVQ